MLLIKTWGIFGQIYSIWPEGILDLIADKNIENHSIMKFVSQFHFAIPISRPQYEIEHTHTKNPSRHFLCHTKDQGKSRFNRFDWLIWFEKKKKNLRTRQKQRYVRIADYRISFKCTIKTIKLSKKKSVIRWLYLEIAPNNFDILSQIIITHHIIFVVVVFYSIIFPLQTLFQS